jgi:hypothetical protein
MRPRMELQRNKIDKNSARVLARLLRSVGSSRCTPTARASNRMKLLFRHRRTFETQTDGHRERDSSAAPDVRPCGSSPRPRCQLPESHQRFGRRRSVLLSVSDSIRQRNLKRGTAPTVFARRYGELFNYDRESLRARRNPASMDVNTIVKSMIKTIVARRS